ncbi:MAG: hypothetical protein CVV56_02090 [Tenericutes bacterium HGW-Tenericutes-1]|jgi:hypothetical protein|nr:MAG: hypothetical protein CVV56_02090 [Tenericutes bacterium HGW-Tenericutes-1]
MKCKRLIVPRLLVKHYLPHPEFGGEILVELKSGMVTDVFTDLNFNLITVTNDSKLIKYVLQNKLNDLSYLLVNQDITLSSVKFSDIEHVMSWMNNEITTNRSYSYNDIRLYLSHSISNNAHLFVITKDITKIGLAGYDVIGSVAIINLMIFNYEQFNHKDYDIFYDTLIKHIQNNLLTSEVLFYIDDTNQELIKLLERRKFVKINKSNSSIENEYRLNTLDCFLTEDEKLILVDFFQLKPEKLYLLSNQDDLYDIEHSIDYSLKTYISLIFKNQLSCKDEYEDIYLSDDGLLSIEDKLLDKYDECMLFLKGEDLLIADKYRKLILSVLSIVNKQIQLFYIKSFYDCNH